MIGVFYHPHLGGLGLLPDLATGASLLLVANIKNEASIIGVREQSEEPKNVTKLRESARNARSLSPLRATKGLPECIGLG